MPAVRRARGRRHDLYHKRGGEEKGEEGGGAGGSVGARSHALRNTWKRPRPGHRGRSNFVLRALCMLDRRRFCREATAMELAKTLNDEDDSEVFQDLEAALVSLGMADVAGRHLAAAMVRIRAWHGFETPDALVHALPVLRTAIEENERGILGARFDETVLLAEVVRLFSMDRAKDAAVPVLTQPSFGPERAWLKAIMNAAFCSGDNVTCLRARADRLFKRLLIRASADTDAGTDAGAESSLALVCLAGLCRNCCPHPDKDPCVCV